MPIDALGKTIHVDSPVAIIYHPDCNNYIVLKATVTSIDSRYVHTRIIDADPALTGHKVEPYYVIPEDGCIKRILLLDYDIGPMDETTLTDAIGQPLEIGSFVMARMPKRGTTCLGFEKFGRITRFSSRFAYAVKDGKEVRRSFDVLVVVREQG